MRCREKKGIAGAILACFLLGCGPGVPAVKRRQMQIDLTVKTVPEGARVYVNSDPMGRSPARVSLPCVVSYREKGDRLFSRRAAWFGTLKTSAAILGTSLSVPVCLVTWPYGLLMGAIAGDRETMLLPVTAARGVCRQAKNLKQVTGRAEATEILHVGPLAGSTVELSAEWEDRVVRRCIDLGWFVRDPSPTSPGPAAEVTLIPDTSDSR